MSGGRATLGDLHRATPRVWLWCERCRHYAPFACPLAVIRWGADVECTFDCEKTTRKVGRVTSRYLYLAHIYMVPLQATIS